MCPIMSLKASRTKTGAREMAWPDGIDSARGTVGTVDGGWEGFCGHCARCREARPLSQRFGKTTNRLGGILHEMR
jgi:hypothetical protein